MRISDCSSDVCSSDLLYHYVYITYSGPARPRPPWADYPDHGKFDGNPDASDQDWTEGTMQMNGIRFKLGSGIATAMSVPLLLAAPAHAQDPSDQSSASSSRAQEDIVVTARNKRSEEHTSELQS